MTTDVTAYTGYSQVGDVITLALCLLNLVLLHSTYNAKDISLRIVHFSTITVAVSCMSHLVCYLLMEEITKEKIPYIYLTWHLPKILLIITFCAYIHYMLVLVGIREQKKLWTIYGIIVFALIIVYIVLEATTQYGKWDFRINDDLTVHENFYFSYFHIYYFICCLIMTSCILFQRRKYITKVFRALIGVMFICYAINIVQFFNRQTSFTTFTYEACILGVLFLFHHNPLDRDTGTLDSKSFSAYIDELSVSSFKVLWLHLDYVSPSQKSLLSEHFFHLTERFFKQPILFRITENVTAMVYIKKKNPGAEERVKKLIDYFLELYNIYHIDYKVVVMDSSTDEKNPATYYIKLYDHVSDKMGKNEIKFMTDEDVKKFEFREYLCAQFDDMSKVGDINDPRVLVYCQPVLDLKSGKFTTGEALMRMLLPHGMAFPDEFIPVAERFGYIHMLSRIILHKTCLYIKEAEEKGQCPERISVNFSINELRLPTFCEEVLSIINDVGIGTDKIAIEITESRNEKDFETISNVMKTLREKGIRFYLDDFGTGYSNFERIIGLPFDIIKFDRAMTNFSAESDTNFSMVRGFSALFARKGCQVLFEGIETNEDEERCKMMNASYLQGYKYSKPVPIDEIESFVLNDKSST
jgi:EAL domain-containing protein (putative c-di-GMP-specific phosphodiesterase class I)